MRIEKLGKEPLAKIHLLGGADTRKKNTQQYATIESTILKCCDCNLEESANMIRSEHHVVLACGSKLFLPVLRRHIEWLNSKAQLVVVATDVRSSHGDQCMFVGQDNREVGCMCVYIYIYI